MSITLITRADDFGSSRSANRAIAEAAVTGGYIKNVSCMAPAPMMEDGAGLLAGCKHICLGMHFTLSAEWSLIKWPPICDPADVPGLVTDLGAFPETPAVFAERIPPMEQVLRELDAQLDFLTQLSLPIRYVDGHMLPEKFIPGLAQAMAEWADRKGLINHLYYYRFPAQMEPSHCLTLPEGLQALDHWLGLLEDGQYFSAMHPAIGGREMLLCTNRETHWGMVSAARNVEYEMLRSREPERLCSQRGISCVRYDEASPLEHPDSF